MKWLLLCFAVLFVAIPAQAEADRYEGLNALSAAQRAELASFIDVTLRHGRTNQASMLELSPTVLALVTPKAIRSGATGQICDQCLDPCREFNLEMKIDSGFVSVFYAGERCRSGRGRDMDAVPWGDRRPLSAVNTRWAVPPEYFNEVRSYLLRLAYLRDDPTMSAQSVMAALSSFRDDAQIVEPSGLEIRNLDLIALRGTLERSSRRGDCASLRRYTACGEVH